MLPEVHGDEQIAVIGEAPGEREEQYGYPFAGRAGEEFSIWLETMGLSRKQVMIDNAILCRPPGNNLDLLMAQAQSAKTTTIKENQKRRKQGLPLVRVPLTPIEACQPHLYRTLASRPYALVMGAKAYSAITGQTKAMRKIRGAFMDFSILNTMDSGLKVFHADRLPVGARALATVKLVPTFHPAFVLRKLSARILALRDFDRLLRWKDGRLDWPTDLRAQRNPSYAELEGFLYGDRQVPFYGIDVETDAKESLIARLRCICFTGVNHGYVVHFRSQDGRTGLGDDFVPKVIPGVERAGPDIPPLSFYEPEEARKIRALIARFLSDPNKRKVGHNWNYYDEEVVQREVPAQTCGWVPLSVFGFDDPGVLPGSVWDTICGARNDHSELPRDLYTTGTRTTDVPAWKESNDEKKLATQSRDDGELADYNLIDGIVTARAGARLIAGVRRRRVEAVTNLDFRMQTIMREMHRMGMYIDEPARKAKEIELMDTRAKHRRTIQDLVGNSQFNPQSEKQMSALFFGTLGLPPLKHSEKTGKPSLDDDVLRAFRRMSGVPEELVQLIDGLRKFRKVSKELGTYVLPIRLCTDLRKNSKGELVGGLTFRDGRLHPHYSVHTPATGRRSSSLPNAHNYPVHLRSLWIPKPGNAFTGADYDQIELRLVSGIAGVESYLIVFREGGDPHATTALLIYGPVFEAALKESLTPEQWLKFKATGSPEKAKKGSEMYSALRTFAKTFVYAVIYGGTVNTIFESVSSAEDPETGELLFPTMTKGDVRLAYDSWMRAAKEIPAWWRRMEEECRRDGYVREPIMGRIRDFPEYSPTEVPNMPIQGGAGVIMARGLCRLRDVLPPNYEKHWGIVCEVHDAAYIEHPATESGIKLAKEMIEEALTQTFPAVPGVLFSAKAKTSVRNWGEIG